MNKISIFILIISLLVILQNNPVDSGTIVTVYTPKGTGVVAELCDELDSATIALLNAEAKTNYPSALLPPIIAMHTLGTYPREVLLSGLMSLRVIVLMEAIFL